MKPLENISTKVENALAERWAKRGSVGSATDVGPLLQKPAWMSVSRISGTDYKEVDVVSLLPHLPVPFFITPLQLLFSAYQALPVAYISICWEESSVYNAAQKAVTAGLSYSTIQKDNTSWSQWQA